MKLWSRAGTRDWHFLTTLALVAVSYCLAGAFAHALSPGQASTLRLWPASGVALIAVCALGYRVWPAIAAAATLTSWWLFVPDNSVSSWLAALLVGFGAAAQACATTSLLKRYTHFPQQHNDLFDWLLQIIIAAPGAATINALWGPLCLTTLGVLPPREFSSAILNWWLGDTISLMALFPLVQLWAIGQSLNKRRRILISATVLISSGLALLGFLYIRHQEDLQDNSNTISHVARIKPEAAELFTPVFESMTTLQAYFNSIDNANIDNFSAFVAHILQSHSGIKSIMWAPRISDDERSGFERQWRERYPDFGIREIHNVQTPRSRYSEYYPILYVEPAAGNMAATGMDLLSEKEINLAINRAVKTTLPQLTGMVTLIPNFGKSGSLMAIAPLLSINKTGLPKGILIASLDIQERLSQAISMEHASPFRISIQDASIASAPVILASVIIRPDASNKANTLPAIDARNAQSDKWQAVDEFPLRAGGKSYIFQIESPVATSSPQTGSISVLLIGLFLSTVLATYLQMLSRHTEHIEQEVNLRTAELERARLASEAANIAKSQFLANMSHEIRTPMTAILGYADILLANAEASSSAQREPLQIIRDSGKHLLNIINDILDISKIEAAQLELHLAPCSISEIAQECVKLMQTRAQEKSLNLQLSLFYPLPDKVLGDTVRIRQVLLNLLGNALKFTDAGQVQVFVEAIGPFAHGWDWSISVRDSGSGLSEQQIVQLFRPFTQLDESMTRRHGGTGLGLYISGKIAKLMQGSIDVKSRVALGSEFTFRFQTQSLPDTQLMQKEKPKTEAPGLTQLKQFSGRVLVAEDNVVNAHIARKMLEAMGLAVEVVGDGSAAVNRLMQTDAPEIDLVFMDMQMPVMDGYEATSTLRASGYAKPVIALTAHVLNEERNRCLRAGCDEFASKPFRVDEMSQLISRFLMSGQDVSPSKPGAANAENSEVNKHNGATSDAKAHM